LNASIESYPLETLIGYLVLDIASMGVSFGTLTVLDIDGSADMALALMISRIIRRVRFPVDLAAAAYLARVYPALSQVHLSRLLMQSAALSPPQSGVSPVPPEPPTGFSLAAIKARVFAGGAVLVRLADRYGLAYTTAQRMVVGVASVLTIYTLLRSGVDVQVSVAASQRV
jgi:hypothetical protein